ncbi:hypothetical protein T01_1836 [Trichinella spiralis]|uniref:Uncharacterized protein n=1 Tax=Trichinella spiralis TaxID=6334 RepID=A0A0V1AJ21_TRISP|nr:hypothetical protein T01_1110 [Trichinella spiralis]KRY24598.1 hypothetical protein T01_1836 [Trichinella spiralis]
MSYNLHSSTFLINSDFFISDQNIINEKCECEILV